MSICRGLQASPLSQHTLSQSCQAWHHVLFVPFAPCHVLTLLHSCLWSQPIVEKRMLKPRGRQCPQGPCLLVSNVGCPALSSALTHCFGHLTTLSTHFGIEQVWGHLLSSLLGFLQDLPGALCELCHRACHRAQLGRECFSLSRLRGAPELGWPAEKGSLPAQEQECW